MGIKFTNPNTTGSGGSGTVTNVSSANADIGVSSGTTTPILTLNSGAGANQIVKRDGSGNLNATTVTTNANLTGDVTSVGNATTLTNAPVIAKVLTGYTSGAGTVAATDSILQAIQKLNGNDATNANLTGDVTSVGNATAIAAGVIVNSDINASAAIDATKIADGSVTSTEFQYINSLSSNAQTQINTKASIAPTLAPWIAPTLLNSWVNYGGSFDTAGYYKDEFGIVHIKGVIKSGTTTASTVLFTLPAGYMPLLTKLFPTISNDLFGYFQINSFGSLLFITGSNASFSVECSFRAEQ